MNKKPPGKSEASTTPHKAEISRLAKRVAEKYHSDHINKNPSAKLFHDLSKIESERSINAAGRVIETLLRLGYHIVTDEKSRGDDKTRAVLRHLRRFSRPDLAAAIEYWGRCEKGEAPLPVELHRKIAEHLIKEGEHLLAYDVVLEGLESQPEDTRLLQLQALVLARSGSTDRARELLHSLEKNGRVNEETLGLLGRIYKDYWEREKNPPNKKEYLDKAFHYYRLAAQGPDGTFWTGINAAVMALLKGDEKLAQELAEKSRTECLAIFQERKADRFWPLSSLGLCCLILDKTEDAIHCFQDAGRDSPDNLGEWLSAKRHVRLILSRRRTTEKQAAALLDCFAMPAVAVFAGHMIDRPDRTVPRFPAHNEDMIRRELKEVLLKAGVKIGFASAACGSDLIFHEVLKEMNADSHIILPYEREQFKEDSVSFPGAREWDERFERALEYAKETTVVSRQKMEFGSISFSFTNQVLYGSARKKAEELETELVPIAIWNGKPGDGGGGTADSVQMWKELNNRNIRIIDPSRYLSVPKETPAESTKVETERITYGPPNEDWGKPKIRVILFADVVKFSRLRENQMPDFVNKLMGGIAALLAKTKHQPIVKNTWGDAIYLVFKKVLDAGLFALDLAELMNDTDWEAQGLNKETNMRISLHIGPVYSHIDPIRATHNYTGSHVNMSARIEPITPPGKVYASQQFSAMTAYYGIKDFVCDYVGMTPLPKGFGAIPTYHVRRP